jgi:hypothetical protein
MIKALLFSFAVIALTSGCIFSKKHRVKENTSITGEVQETFRKRWVDKRVAELVAQGTAAEAARTQAEAEFRTTYDFPTAGKK